MLCMIYINSEIKYLVNPEDFERINRKEEIKRA
jgi:hypothetical protein